MQTAVQTIVDKVLGTGTPPAADPARLAADLRALDVELEAATAAFADAALAEAAGTQDGATARARAEMVRDRLAGRREALAAALSRAQANTLRDKVERDEAARKAVWDRVEKASHARQAAILDMATKLSALATSYKAYVTATRDLTTALPAPAQDADAAALRSGVIEQAALQELARQGLNLGCEVSASLLHSQPTFADRFAQAHAAVMQWRDAQ